MILELGPKTKDNILAGGHELFIKSRSLYAEVTPVWPYVDGSFFCSFLPIPIISNLTKVVFMFIYSTFNSLMW